jgi:hypothetical protein
MLAIFDKEDHGAHLASAGRVDTATARVSEKCTASAVTRVSLSGDGLPCSKRQQTEERERGESSTVFL